MGDMAETREALLEQIASLRFRVSALERSEARLRSVAKLYDGYSEHLQRTIDEYEDQLRQIREQLRLETAERKRIEVERDEQCHRICQSEGERGETKTLIGLLSICCTCKRIRKEDGEWQQLELYIREHSEADFSHGLCPECAQTTYDRFARRMLDKADR